MTGPCICGLPEECDVYQAWRFHERPTVDGGLEHVVGTDPEGNPIWEPVNERST